jgi:hypothetical protein
MVVLKLRKDAVLPPDRIMPADLPGVNEAQARIGNIIIVGNEKTPDAVIRDCLPFYPGQALDYPALQKAEKKLAKKNIRATITVLESDSSYKDILVDVKELPAEGTATPSLPQKPAASGQVPPPAVPYELSKVMPAPHVIEPPDILLIDAIRIVSKPPYHIEPLDVLGIEVPDAPLDRPIRGYYAVDASGTINLGFTYGKVPVVGLTMDQAKTAIEKHLRATIKPPHEVRVQLAASKAMQQIRGEHLVQRDNTINLGTYGRVVVGGLTIPEAKQAIEAHLVNYLSKPEVSVDVRAHLKILIDTQPPRARLSARREGKEVIVDWEIQEGHPDLASLKLEYRDETALSEPWSPEPVRPSLTGRARLRPDFSRALEVRLQVKDLAGNTVTVQTVIPEQ